MRLKNWIAFDESGAGGGSGGDSGSGNGDGSGKKAGEDGSGGGEEKITLTRAELEAQFGPRAKRAAESALKNLFEGLGVKDADALKSILADHRKASDSQKSEADKLRESVLAAEQARDKAIADAKAAAESAAAERLALSIESAATRLGFAHPEDIAGHPALKRDAITIGEDGKIAGVDDALKALAKARPELIAAKNTNDDNTRRRQNQNGDRSKEEAEDFAANWGVRAEYVK